VWFQKLSIPSPWMVTGNSEGVRVSKAKTFKRNYEAKLEFPEGQKGSQVKNHPWGRYGYFLEPHTGY